MKVSEAKKLIGKRVMWKEHYDAARGTYFERTGIIDDVHGRNILIDGDWKWLPELHGLKEI